MVPPRMQRVVSSVIDSVGYDAAHRILMVKFRTGREYYYVDVPPLVHRRMLAADSIGTFFNEVVKPNYPAIRTRAGRLEPVRRPPPPTKTRKR